MSIQEYRAVEVEQQEQEMEDTQQASSYEHEEAASEPNTAKQDESPPTTGSKQWKALYRAISSYAKELRKN